MIIEQSYIQGIKNRDDESFEHIYQMTKRAVYAMVFSVIKNHVTTEDVMQDVYMKMIAKIHQFKEGSNFYNWILQIARNTAIDYYRKDKKQQHLDINDYDTVLVSKDQRPDEEEYMTRILEVLDEEERIIVLLKVVDEMKHRQIAKIVNKPIGTVIWIYQKAIKKMAKNGGYGEKEKNA